ncbi:hypothetical protein DXV76_16125 [Rhodobacteraceae bacterium CCMM004]|nr:hypothetical protein DXV76_16125 [Rhodobacteraceae bacterium CCMM004]
MRTTFLALSLGLGAMALATQHAFAQGRNCAPRPVVLEKLQGQFSETRQSIGMGANGVVVETFANLDTGSWTITVTLPDGVTCIAAAGEGFETLAEALPPQGDPA